MKRTKGYTLVELLLVAGVIAATTGGIFALYRTVSEGAGQEQALADSLEVVQNVQDAFSGQPNFHHLSQDQAYHQGLFGPNAQMTQGRVMLPRLGETTLSPVDAHIQGQRVSSGGFQLTFQSMPAQLCVPVGQAMARAATAIDVNGQALTIEEHSVGPGHLAAACSGSGSGSGEIRMASTFINPGAHEGLIDCVAPAGHQEQTVECGEGLTGSQLQQRDGYCPSPYGSVRWSAWETISSNCAPCPLPETKIQPCAPGEYGQKQAYREYNCPENRWGPWDIQSHTCQRCPTEPQSREVACPGGAAGFILEERRFLCLLGRWGQWAVREDHCPGGLSSLSRD